MLEKSQVNGIKGFGLVVAASAIGFLTQRPKQLHSLNPLAKFRR